MALLRHVFQDINKCVPMIQETSSKSQSFGVIQLYEMRTINMILLFFHKLYSDNFDIPFAVQNLCCENLPLLSAQTISC